LLRDLQAGDPDLQWELEVPPYTPVPMETRPDAKIVAVARQAVEATLGRVAVGGVAYGTDASPLSAVGVPCVVLGPGDIAQAHSSEEYVDLAQVAQAAEIFETIMCSY
jgi:acetylornithine deacetylase